ncbi:hypothetical protein D6D21_10203 [Aureobasidium pullulans]|uniref:Protein kinase domain-containing protein n=1 Tax=Aureobasidium pullulans TaxID=5580 RepID=A0AB74IJ92_AURPU|nr:hypothetical protein D6D21_10203 [Aureobasidium pullulans]
MSSDEERAAKELILDNNDPPRGPLLPGLTWKYKSSIGKGGQGRAHLWVLVDNSGNIIERLVIKNLVAASKAEVVQDGPSKGQLVEAYYSQILAPNGAKAEDVFTAPVLACEPIAGTENGWRTYAPYFSLGNFETLVKKHTASSPLPEPFLWFVLYRMAKAAFAMDEVLRENDRGPVIVHSDIKLDNIFLAHPGSLGKDADFIMYPPAYLADFGFSYTAIKGQSTQGQGGGAFMFKPPEMRDLKGEHTPCYSYTNIWQIGFSVLQAMEGLKYMNVAPAQDLGYENSKWLPFIKSGTFSDYSQELIQAVEACVRFNPEHRISPQSLLKRIEDIGNTDMKRWGTASWILDKQIEQAKKDGKEVDLEEVYDIFKDEDEPIAAAIKRKRKAESTLLPKPKRVKEAATIDQDVLRRRQQLIARQMRLGRTSQSLDAHADDHEYIMPENLRLRYSRDKTFDSQEYFTGSDPGVVVYKNLKSGLKLKLGKIVAKGSGLKLKLDDIIAKKSGLKLKLGKVVPRDKIKPKTVLPPVSVATGTPAVSAASEILATPPAKAKHTITRPISPEKKTILEGGSKLTGALPAVKGKSPVTETKPRDVFAPSTDPTDPLQNERMRLLSALIEWRSNWSQPWKKSSSHWVGVKNKCKANADENTTAPESHYWSSRSICADMNAQERLDAMLYSRRQIKFSLHMWKASFLDRQQGGDGEATILRKTLQELSKDADEDDDLNGPVIPYTEAALVLPPFNKSVTLVPKAPQTKVAAKTSGSTKETAVDLTSDPAITPTTETQNSGKTKETAVDLTSDPAKPPTKSATGPSAAAGGPGPALFPPPGKGKAKATAPATNPAPKPTPKPRDPRIKALAKELMAKNRSPTKLPTPLLPFAVAKSPPGKHTESTGDKPAKPPSGKPGPSTNTGARDR